MIDLIVIYCNSVPGDSSRGTSRKCLLHNAFDFRDGKIQYSGTDGGS